MRKVAFFFVFIVALLVFIAGCQKSDSGTTPTPPEATPVPTKLVLIEMTLPATASGVDYVIDIDTDRYPYNGPKTTLTGTCGASTSVTRTAVLNQDTNYCISAYVNTDGSSAVNGINLGDYFGVWGTVWPNWPATANFSSGVYANITMVAATLENIRTRIAFPEDPLGNKFFACIDTDTNKNNGVIYSIGVGAPSGIDKEIYPFFVGAPGTYYCYAWVDMDSSNWPPNEGDHFGYYNADAEDVPLITAPAGPNMVVTQVADREDFTFSLGIVPSETFTPAPTNTFTPTYTVTQTHTPAPTSTPTAGCPADANEPNNTPAQATGLIWSTSMDNNKISPANDVDYYVVNCPYNPGPSAVTYRVTITTSGTIAGDTYMEVYNSSQVLLAQDDNGAPNGYSTVTLDVTAAAHEMPSLYIKIVENGSNAEICDYSIIASYTTL